MGSEDRFQVLLFSVLVKTLLMPPRWSAVLTIETDADHASLVAPIHRPAAAPPGVHAVEARHPVAHPLKQQHRRLVRERRARDRLTISHAGRWSGERSRPSSGMPAVNYDMMFQAGVRAHGAVNQVIYWSRLPEWKIQTLTPNPDAIYLTRFINTKEVGPGTVANEPSVRCRCDPGAVCAAARDWCGDHQCRSPRRARGMDASEAPAEPRRRHRRRKCGATGTTGAAANGADGGVTLRVPPRCRRGHGVGLVTHAGVRHPGRDERGCAHQQLRPVRHPSP